MSTKSNIDKIIQEKVLNHHEPLDMEKMWNNVYPQIEKPKKNRFFIWIFTGLLCLAAIGFYLNNKSENTDIEHLQIANSTNNIIEKDYDQVLNEDNIKKEIDKSENLEKALSTASLNKDLSSSKFSDADLNNNISNNTNNTPSENKAVETVNANSDLIQVSSENLDPVLFNERIELPQLGVLSLSELSFIRDDKDISLNYIPVTDFKRIAKSKKNGIALGVGYYLVDRKFDKLNDNENFATRATTEKALDAINFGMIYSRNIKHNIDIYLGLKYTSIWEKNEYVAVNKSSKTETVLLERIYTSEGVKEVYGEKIIETTTTSTATRYNEYRNFSIPVGINYRKVSNRIDFIVGGGIDIVLNKKNTGYIFHEGLYLDMEDMTENIFESSLDFNINLSAGIAYHLTNEIDLNFALNTILPTTNLYKPNYGIDHSHYLFGINSGIKYNF
jgi:hypothetical protein